jgi:hypothetical protein
MSEGGADVRGCEEIKKGLMYCAVGCNKNCPYHETNEDYACQELLIYDASALVEQLEEQLAKRDKLLAVMGVSIPKEDDHENT